MLDRSMFASVQYCQTTTAVNQSGPVATVQVQPDQFRTFDNVPLVQHFGLQSSPPKGSIVVRAVPEGDAAKGVVIATLHQPSRVKTLQPGQARLHDAVGNEVRAGNNGLVTATAASSFAVSGPSIRATGNIHMGTGDTGVIVTTTGQTAIVRGGLVHTITAPDGSLPVTNSNALAQLKAEIAACGSCEWLQNLGKEIADEQTKLAAAHQKQIAALNNFLPLLTLPEPTPQAIVGYLEKVADYFELQSKAQITCIQQLAALIQEVAEIPAAIEEAASNLVSCVASVPAVITGTLPAVPNMPALPS